jgi:isocitrate dehydrogenase
MSSFVTKCITEFAYHVNESITAIIFERFWTAGPVVDILGDEMTRVIWDIIKDKLILPFLDVELHT